MLFAGVCDKVAGIMFQMKGQAATHFSYCCLVVVTAVSLPDVITIQRLLRL